MGASVRYRWAAIGGIAVWLAMSTRVVLIASNPSDRFVAAIPDDAFYYFQLARNFTRYGTWTFDGTAPTTGFHPLYAYLLVGLHEVAGDLSARSLLWVVGLVAAAAMGVAAFFTAATVTRLLGRQAVPLAIAAFLTPLALMQATLLMETWLVCVLSAVTAFVVARAGPLHRRSIIGLVTLGAVGSLARTDYVVLPAALALGFLLPVGSSRRDALRRPAYVVAGAVLGLGLVALQDWLVSGRLLQSSVIIKAHWTQVADLHADPVARALVAIYEFGRLLLSTLMPVPALGVGSPFASFLAVIALVAVAVAAAWALARGRAAATSAMATPLVIGSLLALLGLLLLYSRDWRSIQLWYGGDLLVPSAVILAAAGTALLAHRLLVPAAVLCLAYLTVGLAGLNTVTYTNQEPTMRAGIALRTAALDGPVGAWNAGVLGFFSDRGVVNLDGLVNDSAVPYILDGDLAGYLRARGIRYIVDYQAMLTDKQYRLQGGYAGGRLGRCLGPPRVIVQSRIRWVNSSLRMWQVKPDCL